LLNIDKTKDKHLERDISQKGNKHSVLITEFLT